ncbi:Homocysteine S-methyltransferase [Xylariaceae sp. FL0016]|nr:Homocysteine S-methyltransferase [Xylariaceae sp. FL0016]
MIPIHLLDGGLGTSLEDKYHVKFSPENPLWSSDLLITSPDTLRACQSDFAQVPVDILLTATYQVSLEAFARTRAPNHADGIPPAKVPQYLDLAVSIAERVKAPTAQVALSLGPYGATMIPSTEYSGHYDMGHSSADQLLGWHQKRLRVFCQIDRLNSRISYLAFETVPRLDEIVAIRQLIASLPHPDLGMSALNRTPYWISCVFPGDGYTLPDGSTVDQVVNTMLSSKYLGSPPWGIGINCTKIGKLSRLVQLYEAAVSRLSNTGETTIWPSLVLYPDGTNGEIYDTVSKTWRVSDSSCTGQTSPWERQLAAVVTDARTQGHWRSIVVGGCCKATHVDISRLRSALPQES